MGLAMGYDLELGQRLGMRLEIGLGIRLRLDVWIWLKIRARDGYPNAFSKHKSIKCSMTSFCLMHSAMSSPTCHFNCKLSPISSSIPTPSPDPWPAMVSPIPSLHAQSYAPSAVRGSISCLMPSPTHFSISSHMHCPIPISYPAPWPIPIPRPMLSPCTTPCLVPCPATFLAPFPPPIPSSMPSAMPSPTPSPLLARA